MMESEQFFTEINKMIDEVIEQKSKPKSQKTVAFDTKTDVPWNASFSERGFSINGTRLSFELLEDAIKKEYVITLDNGKGMILDAVKMQKLLKYKDLYSESKQSVNLSVEPQPKKI